MNPIKKRLSNELLLSLAQEAKKKYPLECCGVWFYRSDGQLGYRALMNVAQPHRSSYQFRFDPLELLEMLEQEDKKELQLLGFYHSHPSGSYILSENDISQLTYNDLAFFPNLDLLIIGLPLKKKTSFSHYYWDVRLFQYKFHRLIRTVF